MSSSRRKRGAVIGAPSAAGKSFFIRQENERCPKGRFTLIDGDDVIFDTIGWPAEADWHERSEITSLFRPGEGKAIEFASSIPGNIIFFNGKISPEWPLLCSVLPPLAIHEAQVAKRIRNKEGRFPRNMSDMMHNRQWTEEMATKYKIPLFPTFEEAVAYVLKHPDFALSPYIRRRTPPNNARA